MQLGALFYNQMPVLWAGLFRLFEICFVQSSSQAGHIAVLSCVQCCGLHGYLLLGCTVAYYRSTNRCTGPLLSRVSFVRISYHDLRTPNRMLYLCGGSTTEDHACAMHWLLFLLCPKITLEYCQSSQIPGFDV